MFRVTFLTFSENFVMNQDSRIIAVMKSGFLHDGGPAILMGKGMSMPSSPFFLYIMETFQGFLP